MFHGSAVTRSPLHPLCDDLPSATGMLRPGDQAGQRRHRSLEDRTAAPPYRASDAGLRPRPFPGEAASLLPGLLAATRAGLAPASDDELTNTRKDTMAYVTVSPPVLLGARKWLTDRTKSQLSLPRPDSVSEDSPSTPNKRPSLGQRSVLQQGNRLPLPLYNDVECHRPS